MADRGLWTTIVVALVLIGAGWLGVGRPPAAHLELATTTSTYDSGLLDAILPAYQRSSGVTVKVISVGTGQALEYGRRGDADVVLVHSPKLELAFVADGNGIDRRPVCHNAFVIVGPASDPAGIRGLTNVTLAFARIAGNHSLFISRGDESGTHTKELDLWSRAVVTPPASATSWYLSVGQGMAATLRITSEKSGYTLVDTATLAQLSPQIRLEVLVKGDPLLLNPYHVIRVNPANHPTVDSQLALTFENWLTSNATKQAIADYRPNGPQVFIPDW